MKKIKIKLKIIKGINKTKNLIIITKIKIRFKMK